MIPIPLTTRTTRAPLTAVRPAALGVDHRVVRQADLQVGLRVVIQAVLRAALPPIHTTLKWRATAQAVRVCPAGLSQRHF